MSDLQNFHGVDTRATAIGDSLVIAAFDLHFQIESLSRLHRAEKSGLSRQPGDREAAELDVRHGSPRRKLAHGFRDETRREIGEGRRDGEPPGRSPPGFELRDSVDERKGAKALGHSVSAQMT